MLKSLTFVITVAFLLPCQLTFAQKLYSAKKIPIVIEAAESFLNTKYKYGGCSTKGIDCSCLARQSFAQADIDLPRVSRDQAKIGVRVKKNELQKGDLLFFYNGKSHVGIVTKVDRSGVQFIHASTSRKKVMYSRLEGHHKDHLSSARRIFKDLDTPDEELIVNAPKINKSRKKQPVKSTQVAPEPMLVSSTIESKTPGEFPLGSTKKLNRKDIKGLSSCEIKIMKNEIYARQGYVFYTNPKMKKHFNQQSWYKSAKKSSKDSRQIYNALSAIEKHNVNFLKDREGKCRTF